jgi:hypothetical protein
MKNLAPYAACFDRSYPEYADERYKAISDLMALYDEQAATAVIASPDFSIAAELLQPLIAIKNYKSQVPFPRDLSSTLSTLVSVRSKPSPERATLQDFAPLFDELISTQGFQLPTVSAVFHFSHPRHFPIVDVNVQAACAHLLAEHPTVFDGLTLPKLPAPATTPANKRRKYQDFITFLSKVLELQRSYTPNANFRLLDKALMVIGVPALREKVERGECGAP